MGKTITLGGDRLGSGNKNKQELHNYYRSTHNLSQKWLSSMGCGMLYPFLVLPAMRGDSFEIDLHADARTIPTKAPLFGSFKMQLDLFQCPVRLYQAILHNNPTAIGLKMSQVKFPIIEIGTQGQQNDYKTGEFSNNCLMKYLGISGIGTNELVTETEQGRTVRNFNAIPLLAYYDIFKNYYSNKQEENAWVVTGKQIEENTPYRFVAIKSGQQRIVQNITDEYINIHPGEYDCLSFNFSNGQNLANSIKIEVYNDSDTKIYDGSLQAMAEGLKAGTLPNLKATDVDFYFDSPIFNLYYSGINDASWESEFLTMNINPSSLTYDAEGIDIVKFDLKNIDDMRMSLLSFNNLGTAYTIGEDWGLQDGSDGTGLPYSINFATDTNDITLNKKNLNGLMLKTYQSDLYNNWILTDWIEGENGIAAITAISTSGGSFTMDALNLAEKLYNMLNRIAVSGNTYEDWQDAVYTQSPRRHIESPVYLGGMSSEIMFEEIVQTAPATVDGETSQLGTLGGRGKHYENKGGHVNVKCDEASFIIGIVSLTPRIVYTQGNEWYMTDLMSMDDFHKPALDGIGYEDLLAERLAWWSVQLENDGTNILNRPKVGKVPAWINYMTAVDKAFGDFCDMDKAGYMVLSRNYERGTGYAIKDATTYIDPSKYNYAFAYTLLDAQNFWVQIYSDIKARRLMSAKQIPNI